MNGSFQGQRIHTPDPKLPVAQKKPRRSGVDSITRFYVAR
jgi:hypothetical protein